MVECSYQVNVSFSSGCPSQKWSARGSHSVCVKKSFSRTSAAIRQLLAPIEQTARLCGMDYPPPFVVHGTHRLDADGVERAADEYARLLAALRDDRVDFEAARGRTRLNEDLGRVLRASAEEDERAR